MKDILELHQQHAETTAAYKRFFLQMGLGSSPIIAGYLYIFFLDFTAVANDGPVKLMFTLVMGLFMSLVCGALIAGDIGTAIRSRKASEKAYVSALKNEMSHYGIDPQTVVNRTSPDQPDYRFTARLKGREYEFCVRRSETGLVFMRGGYQMQRPVSS
jgi:hypothetical protein